MIQERNEISNRSEREKQALKGVPYFEKRRSRHFYRQGKKVGIEKLAMVFFLLFPPACSFTRF